MTITLTDTQLRILRFLFIDSEENEALSTAVAFALFPKKSQDGEELTEEESLAIETAIDELDLVLGCAEER